MKKANSWEYFNEIAKHHEENKDNLIGNISLEDMWETLVKEQTFYGFEDEPFCILKKRLSKERKCSTPLEVFQDYLTDGLYPPPEYLLWFSKIFDDYYWPDNDFDLEELMFGRKTPAVGTENKRYWKKKKYESFVSYMESKNFREAFEKIGRKHNDLPPIQPSNEKLTQLAGDFINERQLDVDLDSFLRGFRRYKKNKDK
jgi:hypothetical protein